MSWMAQIQNSGNSSRMKFSRKRLLGRERGYGSLYHINVPKKTEKVLDQSISLDDLSKDQQIVYDQIEDWIKQKKNAKNKVLTLGGYAGTGKSTLISLLAKTLGAGNIAFVAYTGKAASVLERKLRQQGISPETCSTIHGFLYKPVTDGETGRVTSWERLPSSFFYQYDLIIVDEASMVGKDIWKDLRSTGRPILAVGDHGQLPPVGSDSFSVIQDPDLRLEKIHRQVADNPIIRLSKTIRHTGYLIDPQDSRVSFIDKLHEVPDVVASLLSEGVSLEDFVIVCRYNSTRIGINSAIRDMIGSSNGAPEDGDPVICLKNLRFNNFLVSNGIRGFWHGDTIKSDDFFEGEIVFPYENLLLSGRFNRHQFNFSPTFQEYSHAQRAGHEGRIHSWRDLGMLFDHAACLSCHKSQGSQWKVVLVIEEHPPRRVEKEQHTRWLYTAVTRASERLIILPEPRGGGVLPLAGGGK